MLVTDWLNNSRLVNLIGVTLACEDGNSKPFVADLEAEVCSDFEHFGQDFEVEVQAKFWSWSLVSI